MKERMIINDTGMVKTSFIVARTRQEELSIHEQRVLLQILKYCQALKNGITEFGDPRRWIKTSPEGYTIVSMPINDAFLSDYKPEDVQKQLIHLRNCVFEWRQKTGPRKNDYKWWACGFIEEPGVEFGAGRMQFRITPTLWKIYNDLSQGMRLFDLGRALNLPTSYAMRFYLLLSGPDCSVTMDIEDFRKWLGLPDDLYRYKNGKTRLDNIEKVIIKPSQKALDETCEWSFEYEKIKESSHPRSSVKALHFWSVERPQNRNPEAEENRLLGKVNTSMIVTPVVYRYLKEKFGFTSEGLSKGKNKATLSEWAQLEGDNMLDWLEYKFRHVANHRDTIPNPQGWLIKAIKGRIEELKGQSVSNLAKGIAEGFGVK